MRVYTAIISEDQEDGGYVVMFPSLPGCHTYGRTLDEAQANAQDALDGFLEALAKIGEIPPDEGFVATMQMKAVAG
jgi:antitoxin HicB